MTKTQDRIKGIAAEFKRHLASGKPITSRLMFKGRVICLENEDRCFRVRHEGRDSVLPISESQVFFETDTAVHTDDANTLADEFYKNKAKIDALTRARKIEE